MRFQVMFDLERCELPIDYRRGFISFFKYALQQYDEATYKHFYENEEDARLFKHFTFSIEMVDPCFYQEIITLKKPQLRLHFSTSRPEEGIQFYAAILNLKNKKGFKFKNGNYLTVNHLSAVDLEDVITTSEVMVQFRVPLLAIDYSKEKKWYLGADDPDFETVLKRVVDYQVSVAAPHLSTESFKIEAIKPKESVVKIFNLALRGNLGVFKLTGSPQLLTYLYQAGMGSRRSSGFGKFDVI